MTKSSKKRSKGQKIANAKPVTLSDEQKIQRDKEEALKAALTLLQDRLKRTSDLYQKDFNGHFDVFKARLPDYKENPAKLNKEVNYYIIFLSHVSLPNGLSCVSIGIESIQERDCGILIK